jgi:hypothetical protein
MKKLFVTATVALMTLTTISCKKTILSLFPGFDVKIPDMQVTIPPIPIVLGDEIQIGSLTSHFNLDSTIRANTSNVFNISHVSSMKVSSMVATLSNGNVLNNLSNFESGRLLISSNTNATPVSLASFSFPTTETYTFAGNTENAPDIVSYYTGTEITYQLYGKLRRPTTQQLNQTVSTTIRVN